MSSEEEIIKEENKIPLVTVLEGVGNTTAEKLRTLGIYNLWDLAHSGSADISTTIGKPKVFCDEIVIRANKYLEENGVFKQSLMTSRQLSELEKTRKKMHSGSKSLDELLGGGIEIRSITEFYGGFASGKTQLCFTLSVLATLPESEGGLDGDVLYIDTEGTYSPTRVDEIIISRKLSDTISDKIHRLRPRTASMLELYIRDIFRYIDEYNIKLIIVDSITNLHRQEYTGREHLADRQHKLIKIMNYLSSAIEKGIAVVVTNQILIDPQGGGFSDPNIASGGTVISHNTTHRIRLHKSGQKIKAKLIDSPRLPQIEAEMMITKKGIEDNNEKVKKM